MHNKQLLIDLREALGTIKNNNQTSVQIDALSRYLDHWERSADSVAKQTEAEHSRQLETWKAELSVSSAQGLEMFKSVIEAGMTALKSSIVINGGAAATLLTLLADVLRANGAGNWSHVLTPLGWAWMFFMCGLGCAGTATGTRYLSQWFYAEATYRSGTASARFRTGGDGFRYLSIILGLGSYALFFAGAGRIFSILII